MHILQPNTSGLESLITFFAGLQLTSRKWYWVWYLAIAILCDLILAALVYGAFLLWSRRQKARATALEQAKLGGGGAGPAQAGRAWLGRTAPVQLTASSVGAPAAATNPYYSRTFTPAPGLQQPLRTSYAYPGAAAQ